MMQERKMPGHGVPALNNKITTTTTNGFGDVPVETEKKKLMAKFVCVLKFLAQKKSSRNEEI